MESFSEPTSSSMRRFIIATNKQPGATQRGRTAWRIHNVITVSQCDADIDLPECLVAQNPYARPHDPKIENTVAL